MSQISKFIIVNERKQWQRQMWRNKKKPPPKIGWSNLPIDLCLQILSKLNFPDRIRFRCACKNWWSLPFEQIDSELPWFLSFRWDKRMSQIQFQLFDTLHEQQQPYTSFAIAIMKKEKKGEGDSVKWSLRYQGSKRGWVFFSLKNKDTSVTSLFLLSPLTRKIVTLPDYVASHPEPFYIKQITFSSNPTSNQCVFFLLVNCTEDPRKKKTCGCALWVETYQHDGGHQGWTTMATSPDHRRDFTQMEYFRGNLFFVDAAFQNWYMKWYDTDADQWDLLDPPWELVSGPTSSRAPMDHHLLESDGELLLVCFHRVTGDCRIYTFEISHEDSWPCWTLKTSLPNRALLIHQVRVGLRVHGGEKGYWYLDNFISFPATLEETRCLENKAVYNEPCTNKIRFVHLTRGESDNRESGHEPFLGKQYCDRGGVWFQCRLD